MKTEKQTHTPGPWRIARSHDRLNAHDIGIARDGVQTVFAECYAEFWSKGDVRPAECEANARLIAAAPDLLAACRAAVESLEAAANDLAEVQFDEKEREKAAEHLADTAFKCRAAITRADYGGKP